MRVGTIDIPAVETTWSTWSYDILQEDLDYHKCKDFGEFLSKVRSGEIDITEYDIVDYETHDSELVRLNQDEAEGYNIEHKRFTKFFEDPNAEGN